MSWFRRSTNANFECCTSSYTEWVEEILPIVDDYTLKDIIPAWSLHRLLFLIPKEVNIDGFKFPLRSDVIMRLEDAGFMYERLIGIIERVIKEGYFNKDYLEERK